MILLWCVHVCICCACAQHRFLPDRSTGMYDKFYCLFEGNSYQLWFSFLLTWHVCLYHCLPPTQRLDELLSRDQTAWRLYSVSSYRRLVTKKTSFTGARGTYTHTKHFLCCIDSPTQNRQALTIHVFTKMTKSCLLIVWFCQNSAFKRPKGWVRMPAVLIAIPP